MAFPNRAAPKYGYQHRGHVAYDAIRDSILAGRLAPGTQLIERVLAEELDISRTPIRDALARLDADGLVERIPHVGVFVRKLTAREALHVLELRRGIECASAGAAAQRATPEDIEGLARLGAEINEANRLGQSERCVDLERGFHDLVAALSGNAEIQRCLRNTHGIYGTLSPSRRLIGLREDTDGDVYDHVAVAEAIGSGDALRAVTAMWIHFKRVHRTLIELAEAEATAPS